MACLQELLLPAVALHPQASALMLQVLEVASRSGFPSTWPYAAANQPSPGPGCQDCHLRWISPGDSIMASVNLLLETHIIPR